VRYARLAVAGDSVEIMEYHERLLAPEIFSDGPLGGTIREVHRLREVVGEVCELASGPITEASLVVPDDWLRVSFAELDGLPDNADERQTMILWKLKRLVPFRVEDLRVTHLEVERLPTQEEEHRILVGFGIESLLRQFEELFTERGVRIGRITNESLSLLGALPEAPDDRVRALAVVTDSGYTIVMSRAELPVLYRYKSLGASVGERRVVRDLGLSRMFLAEQLADAPLQGIGLLAPEERFGDWGSWLEEAFESAVVDVNAYELGVADLPAGVQWQRIAPMIGAVRQEVA